MRTLFLARAARASGRVSASHLHAGLSTPAPDIVAERGKQLAYGAGDEVGVTVDVEEGTIVITRNGQQLLRSVLFSLRDSGLRCKH